MMKEQVRYCGQLTNEKLWYAKPASNYVEGLPVGTGRLAAMVLGGVKCERIALNHEWLWKGIYRNRDTESCVRHLAEVRRLLLNGEYEAGTKMGDEAFGGRGGGHAEPGRVDPYQPAGDLYLQMTHGYYHEYRRELDLATGQVTVTYKADGNIEFRREVIAHLVEDRILMRITASQPFNAVLWLDRCFDPDCNLHFKTSRTGLIMDGSIKRGIDFRVQAAVKIQGGKLAVRADRYIDVVGATELAITINIGTSANKSNPVRECGPLKASGRSWRARVASHRREHTKHYGSMSLDLPLAPPDMPTDQRIEAYRHGGNDPGLPLLYFNYGRYLLCASSATGELPPNLQGKWCEDLNPPWESDYHHDINLQMNYWPAETAGLQRYTNALFTHMENFVAHGRKVANDLYGCRGIVLPLLTDPWGRATPEAKMWAVWIGAAPWLAQHMWWHYEYSRNKNFLKKRCFPFIREIATFYEDYLVKDSQGTYQIVPSQSPENRFKGGGSFAVTLCVSSAMDVQFARFTLETAIEAGRILGVDADRRLRWQEILDHLPTLGIGSQGQLLEWNQEFEEVEPGHRHISHLWGLYPGDQITPETPELYRAARTALDRRLANFGGHTGWSRAWVACCFARLGEGDKAMEHVKALIVDFATDSMLDLHPPRIFQIEGNFGGSAAVLEMLLQSYHNEIDLLPALPGCWPDGKVSGLRARGGYDVDISWQSGKLVEAVITPHSNGPCILRRNGRSLEVVDAAQQPVACIVTADKLQFNASKNQKYTIRNDQPA